MLCCSHALGNAVAFSDLTQGTGQGRMFSSFGLVTQVSCFFCEGEMMGVCEGERAFCEGERACCEGKRARCEGEMTDCEVWLFLVYGCR